MKFKILLLLTSILFVGCDSDKTYENIKLVKVSEQHIPMGGSRYYVSGDRYLINQVLPLLSFGKGNKDSFTTTAYVITSLDGGNCITFQDHNMSSYTTLCNGYTIQTKVKK